mgnify:CR=1 FL=1
MENRLGLINKGIALIAKGLVLDIGTRQRQRNGPVVGGRGTSADDIIDLAGGQNAARAFSGWRPMNSEAIIAANPDFILMSGVHAENIGGGGAVMGRPDIKLTVAGKKEQLIQMDGMLLLGFGPRTADAVAELMSHLHSPEQ